MRLLSLVLVCSTILMSCAPRGTMNSKNSNVFGQKFDTKGAMSYDEFLTKMQGKESVDNIRVKGKIGSVCQVKGCWMNMTSEKSGQPEMFVKFKDYGFFVPKDLPGKTVVMQGKAFYETTSVEELKHYAEDDGKSKTDIDKITQPKKELKFLATGVVMAN